MIQAHSLKMLRCLKAGGSEIRQLGCYRDRTTKDSLKGQIEAEIAAILIPEHRAQLVASRENSSHQMIKSAFATKTFSIHKALNTHFERAQHFIGHKRL